MKIGFDIDDVLYSTSVMIEKEAPRVMAAMNLNPTIDMQAYEWEDMFHLPMPVIKQIIHKLPFDTLEYVNPLAVRAMKQYKQTHPDVAICIVTKRDYKSAQIIAKYIEDYFYLKFDEVYHKAGAELSKLEVCKRNNIAVLFDDHQHNVIPFTYVDKPLAVLVSPPEVQHNKQFAESYPHVLTDWEDMSKLLDNLL